jgi:hypothetical protein
LSLSGSKKTIRLTDIAALMLIALMTGGLFFMGVRAASALPVQDLAQYWAGAHLIGSNPYSQELIAQFERSQGLVAAGAPIVMRNPPQVLLFILPLRFLNYQSAFSLWDLIGIVILAACARAVYGLVSNEASLVPAVLSLVFGPSVVLLMLGQITTLVLVAISLFLLLTERRRDWLAGVALSLAIAKPHVVLLFLAAVVLWSIRNKRWPVLLGGALALGLEGAIAAVINPHIFSEYFDFVREFSRETTPYPNLGGFLYVLTGHHFLAFAPQIAGIIWLTVYWIKHQRHWDWKNHGMYVVMVSLVSCYYSFPFDQVILIPALVIAFANGNRRLFWCGFILTELGFFVYVSGIAGNFGYGPMFLWWTSLGWFTTFVLAQARSFDSGRELRNHPAQLT